MQATITSGELAEQEIHGAKSAVISSLVEAAATVEQAAQMSLLECLRGVPPGFQHTLLASVDKVTLADVVRVLEGYIKPLFETTGTVVGITCNPSKVTEIAAEFTELGRTLEVVNMEEFLL